MTDPHRSYLNDPGMAKAISTYVKTRKVRSNKSNQEICDLLMDRYGIVQTPDNLKNKINRGNFGAQLLVMVLSVLGDNDLDINEVVDIYDNTKINSSS